MLFPLPLVAKLFETKLFESAPVVWLPGAPCPSPSAPARSGVSDKLTSMNRRAREEAYDNFFCRIVCWQCLEDVRDGVASREEVNDAKLAEIRHYLSVAWLT